MPSRPEEQPWDLATPVRDLLDRLAIRESTKEAPDVPVEAPQYLNAFERPKQKHEPSGLGDFQKLWDFLGVPADAPPARVPSLDASTSESSPTETYPPQYIPSDVRTKHEKLSNATLQFMPSSLGSDTTDAAFVDTFGSPPDKDEYTSDGAIYCPPSNKGGVRWRDEVQSSTLEDVKEEPHDAPSTPLTKKQLKKQRQRERKKAELESAQDIKAANGFESEPDTRPPHTSPARKAGVHTIAPAAEPPSTHRYPLRSLSKSVPSTPDSKSTKKNKNVQNISAKVLNSTAAKAPAPVSPKASAAIPIPRTPQFYASSNPFCNHTPSVPLFAGSPVISGSQSAAQKRSAKSSIFFPSSVSPPKFGGPLQAGRLPQPAVQSPASLQKKQPLIVRHGEERHLNLLLKLIQNFGEDLKWLVSPAQLSNHTNSPNGIHVFVDFSNIWLGFNDQVKYLKGINKKARVKPEDISFDSLMLLMERRRPIAKRVLVGSLPMLPAFETAKAVGYETNLLHRVYKAKELTERQKFFAQREGRLPAPPQPSSYASSGSEMAAAVPVYAPEGWVEQGVDEILHLKMMESIVDTDVPSTIVLATGDAAEAEYSKGFMAMVLRALRKGWRVELISWRRNTSSAYRDEAFLLQWGHQFQWIELDDYAEDLLDT